MSFPRRGTGRSVGVMGLIGTWETPDRRWRVEVGGVGSVAWYRLIGDDGTVRNLPSLTALTDAVTAVGLDMGDLHEVESAAHGNR
jgi:hypothetical protein